MECPKGFSHTSGTSVSPPSGRFLSMWIARASSQHADPRVTDFLHGGWVIRGNIPRNTKAETVGFLRPYLKLHSVTSVTFSWS